MRALILALLVGCSPEVIDLGHRDAATDGAPPCACRVPCSTVSTCPGSLGSCGLDHYCTISAGTCTTDPCNATYPQAMCMASETSTMPCAR